MLIEISMRKEHVLQVITWILCIGTCVVSVKVAVKRSAHAINYFHKFC